MKKDSSKFILTLSVILLLIVAITLFVTLNKYGVITGRASDTGTANLTIDTEASISFSDAACDFSNGSVDEAPTVAYLFTNGTATIDGSWTSPSDGLTIQNDGNVNLTVTLGSSGDKDSFIGGTSPSFKWLFSENEAGTCGAGILGINTTYTEISGTPNICSNMDWNDSQDALDIDFALTIPEDAEGTKGTVITATGTAV